MDNFKFAISPHLKALMKERAKERSPTYGKLASYVRHLIDTDLRYAVESNGGAMFVETEEKFPASKDVTLLLDSGTIRDMRGRGRDLGFLSVQDYIRYLVITDLVVTGKIQDGPNTSLIVGRIRQ